MNKKMMKRALTLAAFGLLMAGGMMNASAMDRAPVAASKAPAETIDASKLSNAWDKTFPEDARVSYKKVTFHNRYGITLVGDLYTPKDMKPGEKLDAIAVAGPYGAVKEQVSGRYAQELAARGFLTLAFDPSYTGESGGQPRNTTSPDIDTKIFWQLSITCPTGLMLIRRKSASSASAAGAALPSMRHPWTRESKRP